jgi:hypothetical protein
MSADDDFLYEEERPAGRWARFRRALTGPGGGRLRRVLGGIALAVLAVVLLYYPVGMIWVHKIDDDIAFAPADVPEGGSRAVALAAGLIDREINRNRWTANDPFFMPGWALDNMPNYQLGLVSALSRFAIEMTDQIGCSNIRARSGCSIRPRPNPRSSSTRRPARRCSPITGAWRRATRCSTAAPTTCSSPSSASPPISARPRP